MTTNVHITYTPALLDRLRAQLDASVRLTVGEDVPPDTHILVAGRPTVEQLAASEGLHTLLIPFTGLPGITRERLRNFPGIAAHNIHHNAAMTAEMAIALLMAAARALIPAHNTFRQGGDWSPRHNEHNPTVMLAGKTALVLGYGAIGQLVGAVCEALGMTVLGVRRRPSDARNVFTPGALPDLLPRSNVVIVALPGTPETEGMLGATELALLPPRSILVNVGRAAVVDEAALYHALKDGTLHAAGLDVWYRYPDTEAERSHTLPSEYPFWELENVVMSPHRAGGLHADELEQLRINALANSLNAAARGEAIPHPVDLDAGY